MLILLFLINQFFFILQFLAMRRQLFDNHCTVDLHFLSSCVWFNFIFDVSKLFFGFLGNPFKSNYFQSNEIAGKDRIFRKSF